MQIPWLADGTKLWIPARSLIRQGCTIARDRPGRGPGRRTEGRRPRSAPASGSPGRRFRSALLTRHRLRSMPPPSHVRLELSHRVKAIGHAIPERIAEFCPDLPNQQRRFRYVIVALGIGRSPFGAICGDRLTRFDGSSCNSLHLTGSARSASSGVTTIDKVVTKLAGHLGSISNLTVKLCQIYSIVSKLVSFC